MKMFLLGLTLMFAGAAVQAEEVNTAAVATCVLWNPYYVGHCGVTEVYDAEDTSAVEVCDAVLAYLQNPLSSGKTYCAFTALRFGWSLVSVDGEPVP